MVGVAVLYGGELACEIAERLVKEGKEKSVEMSAHDMASFQALKLAEEPRIVIFVIQTVENDEPPESAG
eukprot:2351370-Rhodomonas_salina.1